MYTFSHIFLLYQHTLNVKTYVIVLWLGIQPHCVCHRSHHLFTTAL